MIDLLPANLKQSATGAASQTRKFATMSSLVSGYVAEASLGKLRIKDRDERLKFFTQNVGKWSARALSMMNFEIKVFGKPANQRDGANFLMVGNHMSYLDVMILSSIQPSVFVTSVDMGEVFFLGAMAEMGGSIFIERRHRGQIEQDLKVMSTALTSGFNVMIYPEGTSSDGQKLLPFKKSLLMSAVDSGRDILPVVTKYVEIDGEPFSAANCEKVAWFGDMGFAPHFFSLLKVKNVKVEVHFLEPILVGTGSTRSELAEQAYTAIEAVYMSDKPKATTDSVTSVEMSAAHSG